LQSVGYHLDANTGSLGSKAGSYALRFRLELESPLALERCRLWLSRSSEAVRSLRLPNSAESEVGFLFGAEWEEEAAEAVDSRARAAASAAASAAAGEVDADLSCNTPRAAAYATAAAARVAGPGRVTDFSAGTGAGAGVGVGVGMGAAVAAGRGAVVVGRGGEGAVGGGSGGLWRGGLSGSANAASAGPVRRRREVLESDTRTGASALPVLHPQHTTNQSVNKPQITRERSESERERGIQRASGFGRGHGLSVDVSRG
jgi:hypothetical protein